MEAQLDERKTKIGIIGCGAIGSAIAKAIQYGLHPRLTLSGIYDISMEKVETFCTTHNCPHCKIPSINALIEKSDLIVEAVNAKDTAQIIRDVVEHKTDVLVLSVGSLLTNFEIFDTAQRNHVRVFVPSGAISGIDALKAAAHVGIDSISLTTYKPIKGLQGAPFFDSHDISLDDITEETVVFEGSVDDAVEAFPQNINVAATIALATGTQKKLKIRIVTSPTLTHNRHEIIATGSFGEIHTVTRNVPSHENPKTSYMAILSGIAFLKSYCSAVKIGT